ncbi:MAG: polymer-forming cytoskeletal protein [Candidatus Aminicenantes bacterium]|nr:polymer-forming cytoskeletal protein [Candidatus Aminicenantes bacterium]
MDNKKKMLDSDKITGFFDKDTEIDGNLTFKGSFRIDGHFKGKIDSESILIIGEKGKVEADVNIGYIIINGEIKGNIQATEKVEINATGRVIGSVITPKLIVEEGAYLETNCQTSDQIPLPKTEKEKEVEQGYQS